jgi:hypothetical protein
MKGLVLNGLPPSICRYSIARILLSNSRFISRITANSLSFSIINLCEVVNRGEERGVC